MLRFIGCMTMGTAFLVISPPLRASVLNGLGQATFQIAKYSPYSYIGLALALGVFAVKSLASERPQ
jgi:hypothetical protein